MGGLCQLTANYEGFMRDNLKPPLAHLTRSLTWCNTSPEEPLRDNAIYHTKQTTKSVHGHLLCIHLTIHWQQTIEVVMQLGNSNAFSILREHVTRLGLQLTNTLSSETTTWTFDLHVIKFIFFMSNKISQFMQDFLWASERERKMM